MSWRALTMGRSRCLHCDEQVAGLPAQAFAGLTMREGQDVRAHARTVKAGRGPRRRTPGFPPAGLVSANSSASIGSSLRETQLVGRAVAADRLEALARSARGRAPRSRRGSRAPPRSACRPGRDVPRLHHRRHIRAGIAAAHRDRPVGVQLHLERELLGLASGEINADLAHRLDDRPAKSRLRVRCRRTRRARPRVRRAQRTPGPSASVRRCGCRRTAHTGTSSRPATEKRRARRS